MGYRSLGSCEEACQTICSSAEVASYKCTGSLTDCYADFCPDLEPCAVCYADCSLSEDVDYCLMDCDFSDACGLGARQKREVIALGPISPGDNGQSFVPNVDLQIDLKYFSVFRLVLSSADPTQGN